MQAIVKQTADVAMMLGAKSSVMCISCSMISAGVGMEAMLSVCMSEKLKFVLQLCRGKIFL